MNLIGIDISLHHSKLLKEFLDTRFDYVVTVCGRAHAHRRQMLRTPGRAKMFELHQHPHGSRDKQQECEREFRTR